jgi:hypothetical protein
MRCGLTVAQSSKWRADVGKNSVSVRREVNGRAVVIAELPIDLFGIQEAKQIAGALSRIANRRILSKGA